MSASMYVGSIGFIGVVGVGLCSASSHFPQRENVRRALSNGDSAFMK